MQKIDKDYVYQMPGYRTEAHCWLQIFEDGDQTVVIFSELPDNPGRSVTNASDWLATCVVQEYALDPAKTRFIEYYPPEDDHPRSYDEITYTWTDGVADVPQWKPLDIRETEARLKEVAHAEN